MRNKGFTLLELVVVVAIIAILSAIAVPTFIGKLDKAKDASDLAEINAVQKAMAMYYIDNGNYPTLQGADVSLGQPQPIEGSAQNVEFSKLVPNYLAKLPHFSYWWVDYKGMVYHTQKPIGNVASNVFTPTTGYTYTVYSTGGTIVLSGAYTLQAGDYILGKDDKGRDLPKISAVFKNEKQHPESPEATGTSGGASSGGTSSVASGNIATMLTAEQWATFDWSKVVKPTGQVSANIGVDAWGNPVNMDLWSACKITDGSFGTVNTVCLNAYQGDTSTGYLGTVSEGKIEGYVPAKVKISGDIAFASVTGMAFAFQNCTLLTTAPVIPSSVTSMSNTFYLCINLITAPVIPSGVTNLDYTFDNCSSLTTAPIIPSSVTNMDYTFLRCINLATAPVIPSSVTSMDNTFFGCTKLGY